MEGFIPADEANRRTAKVAQRNKEQLETEDENWLKLEIALATSRGDYEIMYRLKHPHNWELLWRKLTDAKYQLELLEENGQPKSFIVRWS